MLAAPGEERPAPAKRRRLPKEKRQEQLLDIAERLIVENGYEATSIEDVVRAAGVSRPVLYEHYGSKEGLLLACCRRARTEFEESFVSAVKGASGGDVGALVQRAGEVYFGMLERDPRRWMILFSSTTAQSGVLAEGLTSLRHGTIQRIAAVIAEHAPEAAPTRIEACAYAISGVGEQLGRWWVANPRAARAEVVGIYRDFIAGGLLSLFRAPPGQT